VGSITNPAKKNKVLAEKMFRDLLLGMSIRRISTAVYNRAGKITNLGKKGKLFWDITPVKRLPERR